MPEQYATKNDLERVENKFDAMATNLFNLSSDVRSIRENLTARESAEKQSQVLIAETAAARAVAATEKAANAEEWTKLKTRALWGALAMLTMLSFPQIAIAFQKLRGMMP